MKKLYPLLILVALSQMGASTCNGDITRDPGFDLWCGDLLCAWKLERGDVARVPTWHESDSGVGLLGSDTAIEQFTPVDSADGTCIQFDMLTNVDASAEAELGVDIYGDGTLEKTFSIGAAHWKPVSYVFAVKPPFTGVRFEIAKHGPGNAVLARMRAHVVDAGNCAGIDPLFGGPAPLGAKCNNGGDCASAKCTPGFFGAGRCVGCTGPGDCTTQQVCGLGDPTDAAREVPVECVAKAARQLGEQCLGNGECASGMCTDFVCSTCSPGSCTTGTCTAAYDRGPSECNPNRHQFARGAACATNADCASGTCSGPAQQRCEIGDQRSCSSSFNCPVNGDLQPMQCVAVGVQGGSCD